MSSLPTEAEVIRRISASRPRKDGAEWFANLKSALQEHRGAGSELMERLSNRPEYTVRAWTSGVAAKAYGRAAVPLLLRLAEDRTEIVRACALGPLLDIAPDAAHPVVATLRKRLRRHRPDVPGQRRDDPAEAGQLIWAVARLKATEAIEDVRAYMARPDSDPSQISLASVVCTYLESGEEGIAQRLRDHDHNHVPRLCQITWRCCSGDAAWRSMSLLHCTAGLDVHCMTETMLFLAAKEVASSGSERPYWAVKMPHMPQGPLQRTIGKAGPSAQFHV